MRLRVTGGVIRGIQAGNIRVYKGIPYAKPPVGELRFAPPQDAEPWNGELDCARFGPQCPQVPVFAGAEPFSEDCLTLNVWTPAEPGEDARLPVCVFIHGGGFAAGSGSFPMYDGTSFAEKGIVMVTINYRLGALGFFASRETFKRYGTTGNWGILDQIKSLEWVRDNIAAFGGDSGKVTIAGESAGSISVSALLTSPLAQGLFRGVIMESGSVLSLSEISCYARGDLQKSIEVSRMLSDIFGAGDDADGLAKMRKADAEILTRLCAFSIEQTVTPMFFLTPVFDGRVIPKDQLGAMPSGVNLLLGFNGDEGSLFIPDCTDEAGYRMLTTRVFGWEKALQVLDRFRVDARNSALRRARQVFACGVFSAGMKRLADAAADAGGVVYMYKFGYVSPDNERNGLGAIHTAELPFAFNTLASTRLSGPDAEKLAHETHARWVNFIKSGDPNAGDVLPSGVKWPRYDTKKAEVLYLDRKISSGPLDDREDIDYIADLTLGVRN
jgi:para-nitrobenzyl esterase